jgi:hypothetical protein
MFLQAQARALLNKNRFDKPHAVVRRQIGK